MIAATANATSIENVDEMINETNLLVEQNATISSAVNPVLKAHITSLVSALGGPDHTDPNATYVLGDDALACLRDLKRWIKGYDEKQKKWDVARAISETSLVRGDLLNIIAIWEEKSDKGLNSKYFDKIAVACLELLVQLTWPLELTPGESTINQVRHIQALQTSQLRYKHAILSHPSGKILHAIVRLTLPSIALPKIDRTSRDNGIIRLVVYFFRNLLRLEPQAAESVDSRGKSKSQNTSYKSNLPPEIDPDDISISTVIEEFDKQDVFDFLLMITGGLSYEFDPDILGVGVMEAVYFLINQVKADELFEYSAAMIELQPPKNPKNGTITPLISSTSKPHSKLNFLNPNPKTLTTSGLQLQNLLLREHNIKRKIARDAPTRHNRFGSLLSIELENQNRMTVSGQNALLSEQRALNKLDASKKWRNPYSDKINYDSDDNFGLITPISYRGLKILREFIEQFLDGAFNPLIMAMRKQLERDADSILPLNQQQYLLVIAWFLEAEKDRRVKHADKYNKKKFSEKSKIDDDNELDEDTTIDFGLIGAALRQENFIIIMKIMRESFESKKWNLVHASMICFTQILQTILVMQKSESEEDRDIAQNIKTRLFYEEFSLDLLATIPRTAYLHSPEYMSTVIDLTHLILKTLEDYSKQDTIIFIKSKRRGSKKKSNEPAGGYTNTHTDYEYEGEMNDDDIERVGRKESNDRKFNFSQFESKYIHLGSIETYRIYLSRYQELSDQQIKKCLKFFYRVFVKRECHVYLYKLDLMLLFHTMLSDTSEGLSRSSPVRKELSHFLKYYMKKLRKNLEQTPSLFVELLFTKMHNTMYYLEHGEQQEKKIPTVRIAAELAIKSNIPPEKQFAIIVAALIDDNQRELVQWVSESISSIIDKRRSWVQLMALDNNDSIDPFSAPDEPIVPVDDEQKKALIKNGKLRLLLSTIGATLPETPTEICVITSNVSIAKLEEADLAIKKYLNETVEFDENKVAMDYIKRKPKNHTFDDSDIFDVNYSSNDNDTDGDNGDEDIAFTVHGTNSNSNNENNPFEYDPILDDDGAVLPKGIARKKGTHKHKKKSHKRHRKHTRDEREPRKKQVTNNHQSIKIKSSEFIADTDDDSDDEKYKEFFEKEQKLRELISDQGTNGPTLMAMKESWKLIKSHTTDPVVHPDINPRERDHDDELFMSDKHSKELLDSNSHVDSDFDSESDFEVNSAKKIARIEEEDDDDEEVDDATQHGQSTQTRRRVILDDSDEDDYDGISAKQSTNYNLPFTIENAEEDTEMLDRTMADTQIVNNETVRPQLQVADDDTEMQEATDSTNEVINSLPFTQE